MRTKKGGPSAVCSDEYNVKTHQAYQPISDYALIGNTHSAALIGRDGAIDWCCLPQFDSPAVFCRLLDAQLGGYFKLAPAGAHRSTRRYAANGAALETEFSTAGGAVRVTDFMHSERLATSRIGIDKAHCHRLLRCIDGLGGDVELEVALRPTFDFARQAAHWNQSALGWHVTGGGQHLLLESMPVIECRLRGDIAQARLSVRTGERAWLIVSQVDAMTLQAPPPAGDPEVLLEETRRHWAEWDRLYTYEGPYQAQVRISARVLKLLTFGPTGALVAAPTASLPELVGGARNWDYRFCWLRDSALVLRALMAVGYHEAAMDFFRWLEELCQGECDAIQIMYRIDGGRDLPEQELEHLEGYRGSQPVRIGNAAAQQKQLDAYGHVLDAVLVCHEGMRMSLSSGLRHVLARLADEAAAHWREPDQGFWESRGPPQHFVSSKLMCWVALDRAVRLAATAALEGNVDGWRAERDAVRQAILEHGYDARAQAFTQAFGSAELDASALLIPLVGFLPAGDERMANTVESIRHRLMNHGLVYRYGGNDGVAGGEAALAMCSFWMVDNLALQARVDEACMLFEHIVSFSSDLGLLSEEIDPLTGQLLGNYPQGFTHLALIESALAIGAAQRRQMRGAQE
ncbi:glycoside hydrolase family 15 protein [Variovorax paradoxus]|uniref:Glycoside hydrolase family 15 protein n=1 Tax=Variovorax paradoxus TaxID=34073 RepID=A0A5Q0LXE8_VARPD|nr:glycoside hydrolase family 15 protein [Variovorax paradoxus]